MSIDYSKYPWLCNTMTDMYHTYCDTNSGRNVAETDVNLTTELTIEGYDLFGLQCVYYCVTHDIARDVVYGEDPLQYVSRAFNFKGYIEQLPANVRTYRIEGIWGEDLLKMFVSNTSFRYFSTYGNTDRNTPNVYEQIIPRIGDIIYIPGNKTFYDILDVKYYTESFGLKSQTYTLTLKVYQDNKYTVSADNPTLSDRNDPIYNVASYPLSAQDEYHDVLAQNDELNTLQKSKNVNYFNYIYNENEL